MEQPVLIRTKINNQKRFVKLMKSEFNVLTFIQKALEVHEIKGKESIEIELYDNCKTPLSYDDAVLAIEQFIGCSHFWIELHLSTNDAFNLSQDLKCYLIDNDCASLFREEKQQKELSKTSRKNLMKYLHIYLHSEFSTKPTVENIIAVCEACVELFPSLKDDDGGIHKLFNYNERTGYFFFKLRNTKKTNQQQQTEEQNVMPDSNNLTEEAKIDLNLFLKNSILSNDIELLKTKLLETVKYRQELLKCDVDKFFEISPFYFISTELITYDFGITYPDCNETALFDVWPQLEYVKDITRIDKTSCALVKRNPEIDVILSLINFIPKQRITLLKAQLSFIIYSNDPNDDPMELIDQKNESPHIIAIFSFQDPNKAKYYITIKGRIVSIPMEYNFIQVIDLFFKVHKLFGQEFNTTIKPMMTFLEYYVYGMRESSHYLTPKIREAASKLLKRLE